MQPLGAITPMVTPTTSDSSEVDTEALESFTSFLIEGGTHVLFPCGSLGEFSSLSREQRFTVIETVVDQSDDVPVVAGCGGTSLVEVNQLVEDAARAGADAAVVVTPYYLNDGDRGLVDFYNRVVEETPLPILLYNIPSLADTKLSVDAVSQLAAHDEVIGIKDSTGDIIYHHQLIESTPDSFFVLQGMAELAISSLDLGADGFVAGPANVYPDAVSSIYDFFSQGDRQKAVDFWQNISNPIVAATKPIPTATGLKYLLRCRGRDVGDPLPPLARVSEQDKERLDDCHRRTSRRYSEMRSQLE